MTHEAVLGTIGLAKRAGRLALGDDMARELCRSGKARCVLIASDIGAATGKKAAAAAADANIPCITLPYDTATLGGALGREHCAVCAIGDIGLASAVLQKLSAMDSAYAADAASLAEKNTRIQSRKGKKKTKPTVPPVGGSGADHNTENH